MRHKAFIGIVSRYIGKVYKIFYIALSFLFFFDFVQITIHPFVVYYRDENQNLQHYNYVVISECIIHDTNAVHLFISKLLTFLKTKLDNIYKIYYFTDGCAAQYKNKKNFVNIVKHSDDFGIPCEWHFHATAHGKGPCDGIGGTVKRMAARYSK